MKKVFIFEEEDAKKICLVSLLTDPRQKIKTAKSCIFDTKTIEIVSCLIVSTIQFSYSYNCMLRTVFLSISFF